MRRLRQLLARVRAPFAAKRLDADLEAEVNLHLEMLADEHERQGMSRDDARLAARREFGGVARTIEDHREQRGLPFFDTLRQDVVYAVRLWRRAPGFAIVVMLVLALGIGANSAMFTLVNALLFRPMTGRAGDLVGLYSHDPAKPNSYRVFSYPNYADIREQRDLFEALIAQRGAELVSPYGDTMRRTFVALVSDNFFSALGTHLAAGRGFTADECKPGANVPVAIASYEAWQKAGFDPSFIGRTIRLNTTDFTIVGITPRGFTGTTAIIAREYWLPLGVFETVVTDALRPNIANRSNNALMVAGLLKPGVTLEQANARLAALSSNLARAYPAENRGQVLTVHRMSRVNLSSSPSNDAGPAVLSAVIMPLSGAVLLIACLNIANMLLARATARRKEIAVRLALGGGRARIVRQLVTESLVLAGGGAVAGLLIGWWAARLFTRSLEAILPLPLQLDPQPDRNIVLVTTALACLSAIAFGLMPALKISRPDVVDDLKDLGAARDSTRRFGARAWLVVAQVAVSLVLMTAGGLFARAALKADVADPGYRYEGLLLASVDPTRAGYKAPESFARMQASLARLGQIPGVAAVGVNSQVPFGDYHQSVSVERAGHRDPGHREPTYTLIAADYFAAIGLPILRGRAFTRTEELSSVPPRVAIIDEPLARRLFDTEDPIGQQVQLPAIGAAPGAAGVDHITVVGVVPGIRDELTEREPAAHIYLPWTAAASGPIHFHVRTAATVDAATLLPAIRQALRDVDDRMPILDLRTMQDFHERGLVLWVIRAAGRALSGLGALAMLLACIGVYGVKSYIVSQRTREIGIRIALGAQPREIGLMLFRDGARTTLLGVAIGFPLALLLGKFLSVAIFEVSAFDPVALTVAPLVLALAAALATYVPARRGMKVSPLDALRTE